MHLYFQIFNWTVFSLFRVVLFVFHFQDKKWEVYRSGFHAVS